MNEKIHELRSYLNLSLKAFGERIGYTGMHISQFEKNIATPDERVIQKICQAFQVEPSYFSGELSVEHAVQKKEDCIYSTTRGVFSLSIFGGDVQSDSWGCKRGDRLVYQPPRRWT